MSNSEQSGLFQLALDKPATPLTPEEIEWLRRRRPLWSKEASDAFEFAGHMDAIESPDSANFLGAVDWPRNKGRPPEFGWAVAARAKAALEAEVRAYPAKKTRRDALHFLFKWFKDQKLAVPRVGQLNRAFLWPVLGKKKRKSGSPSSAPNPMTEYTGNGTHKYVLSTDPRAFQQCSHRISWAPP
jgi:hypothetical protein